MIPYLEGVRASKRPPDLGRGSRLCSGGCLAIFPRTHAPIYLGSWGDPIITDCIDYPIE